MLLKRWKQILLLLFIVLAGFLLRYAGLYWGEGYHYFAIGDEINAYRVAQEYLAGNEQARYLGQPDFAGGRVPGPLWALFWAVPLRWGASPGGGHISHDPPQYRRDPAGLYPWPEAPGRG